jgi:hypothetical protein
MLIIKAVERHHLHFPIVQARFDCTKEQTQTAQTDSRAVGGFHGEIEQFGIAFKWSSDRVNGQSLATETCR